MRFPNGITDDCSVPQAALYPSCHKRVTNVSWTAHAGKNWPPATSVCCRRFIFNAYSHPGHKNILKKQSRISRVTVDLPPTEVT